ncbi:MAG: hypothetical protein KGM97_01185, partial [Alphaproteobacteria bacterium]|nr:hypothetical protein [Alphaproteobacteria bacterium]
MSLTTFVELPATGHEIGTCRIPKRAPAPSPSTSHSYLVCAFQSGEYAGIWTTACSAAEAIHSIRENRCLIGHTFERATETIRTDIIVLGNYWSGVGKGYRHTFSEVELERPRTMFIGAISREDLKAQMAAANEAAIQKEEDLQRRIKAVAHLTKKVVLMDQLPEHWKLRIRQSSKGCWIWKTADESPYRRVYFKMKGAVP